MQEREEVQEGQGCRRRCRGCERCRGTGEGGGAGVQMAQCQKKKNPQPGRLERAQLNGSACPASASQAAPARSSRRPARPGGSHSGGRGQSRSPGRAPSHPRLRGPATGGPAFLWRRLRSRWPRGEGKGPAGSPTPRGSAAAAPATILDRVRKGGLSQEGTRTMESDARPRAGSRTPARASGISGAGGGTRHGEGGWRRMAPEDEPYLSTASAYGGGSPNGGGNLPSLPVLGAASPPSRLPGRRRGMPEVGPTAGLPRRALRGCL